MVLFTLLLNVLWNAYTGRQLYCKLINDLHFQSIFFLLLFSSQSFIKSIEHYYASITFLKQINTLTFFENIAVLSSLISIIALRLLWFLHDNMLVLLILSHFFLHGSNLIDF